MKNIDIEHLETITGGASGRSWTAWRPVGGMADTFSRVGLDQQSGLWVQSKVNGVYGSAGKLLDRVVRIR